MEQERVNNVSAWSRRDNREPIHDVFVLGDFHARDALGLSNGAGA
jgi:hypothetical protein